MLHGERCQGSSMNALRAPLTALSAPLEECRHFLLDKADAFIDGRFWVATEASGRLANQGITSFGFKPSPVKSRLKATYNC